MKSLLQSLFDGEISPEELILPKDPKYQSLNQKISDEKKYFENMLSEEDNQRFIELDDFFCHRCLMESEASFMYGFRLGAMLMVEVFMEKDELVRSTDS